MLTLLILITGVVSIHFEGTEHEGRLVDNSAGAAHSVIRTVTEPEPVADKADKNQAPPDLKKGKNEEELEKVVFKDLSVKPKTPIAAGGPANHEEEVEKLSMRHELVGLAIAVAVSATSFVGYRYQFGAVKGKPLHPRTGLEYQFHHPEVDKLIKEGGEEIGKLSVSGLVFSLVTTMVGAGVLTFPGVMKQCGWYVGPFVILAGGIMGMVPDLIFRDVMDAVGACPQYRDVVQKVFGERGGVVAECIIQGFIFGVTGIYVVLIGETLDFLFPWSTRGWVLATGGLMIPASFIKDVSMLAKLSAVGVLASVLYVVCIAGGGLQAAATYDEKKRPHGNHWPEGEGSDQIMSVVTNMSVAFFGYQCAHMLPALKNDMEQPEKLGTAVAVSVFVVMGIYLVVGAVGYYGWGNNVDGLVLNSMCASPGCAGEKGGEPGARMEFGFTLAGAVIANLAVSLPLLLFVFFQSLEARFSSLKTSWLLNGGTRVMTIVLATVIAVFTPYFKELLGLFSSSFGVAIGLLVPSTCSIKLHRDSGKPVRWDAILVLLLGVGLFVLGMYGGSKELMAAINAPGEDHGFWHSKWKKQ